MSVPNLVVVPPPHLAEERGVSRAMRDVMLAMVPVTAVALYFFRLNSLLTVLIAIGAAAGTEVFVRNLKGLPHRLHDGSAVVTGWMLALCLPAATPWWLVVIAAFLAVGVAKELVGGLGWNIFNPALFGRACLVLLAPLFVWLGVELHVTRFHFPAIDAVSLATPLAMAKQGDLTLAPEVINLFLAYPGGAIGETSALALLVGAAYLIYRKHISWRIPVTTMGTVFILTALLGHHPLFHVLAGGLILGACFMATDWVTSPVTPVGQLIFGAAIGALVVVFRLFTGASEAVAFSILILNPLAPTIDWMTKPKRFGDR